MIIKTNSGLVKGKSVKGVNNLEQFRFTGIPYAKPPIGLLRFSPPVPIEPWDGVKDVTELPNVCCQLDYDDKIFIGSEDCLYLNIFTSNVKPDTLMPVMFWIGGWAFTFDNVSMMGPELMLEQGVVFVQCVYRLGPFGFLSTGDANAPGNSGLKDIVLGLRWVKQNISCFGGDPDSITLFGTSSGGAIVHYMMLSPSTAGLFNKAIAQSGSALNIWAIQRNPSRTAIELAKELGKNTTDLIEVVDFLRSVPAVEIVKACDRMGTKKAYKRQLTLGDYQFLPCKEVEMEGIESFITKNPLIMIKSNMYHKVPLIIGSNKNESLLFLKTLTEPLKDHLSLVSHDFDVLVPEELMDLKDSYMTREVGKQILEFYIQDGVITQESLEQYLQYLADFYFIFHIQKTVKLHASNNNESPIYYYIFEFIGNWDLSEKYCGNEATHADEIAYLFVLKGNHENYKGNHDSIRTRQRFIKMWTNFAKYGNPTPDENDKLLQVNWEPVRDPEKLTYLNIGSELTLGRNPYADRMEFWNDIFDKTLKVRIMTFFEDSNKTS